MTGAFDQEFAERQCCQCGRREDLCPLGSKDLCPQHFREAIADLEIQEQDKQENSGAWEK